MIPPDRPRVLAIAIAIGVAITLPLAGAAPSHPPPGDEHPATDAASAPLLPWELDNGDESVTESIEDTTDTILDLATGGSDLTEGPLFGPPGSEAGGDADGVLFDRATLENQTMADYEEDSS